MLSTISMVNEGQHREQPNQRLAATEEKSPPEARRTGRHSSGMPTAAATLIPAPTRESDVDDHAADSSPRYSWPPPHDRVGEGGRSCRTATNTPITSTNVDTAHDHASTCAKFAEATLWRISQIGPSTESRSAAQKSRL
ncbi:MAG: hypothetical protein R2873_19260 [Caldilineaceae bacterium]